METKQFYFCTKPIQVKRLAMLCNFLSRNKQTTTYFFIFFVKSKLGERGASNLSNDFDFLPNIFWSPLRILFLSVAFLQFFNFLFLSCARNNNDNIFKQFLNNFYIFILQMFSNQLFFTVTVSNFKQFNGFIRKFLCFIISTLTT